MSNTAYVFDSPRPIVDALGAVFGRYWRPVQHDAHVRRWRAYGGQRGWLEATARREAARLKYKK